MNTDGHGSPPPKSEWTEGDLYVSGRQYSPVRYPVKPFPAGTARLGKGIDFRAVRWLSLNPGRGIRRCRESWHSESLPTCRSVWPAIPRNSPTQPWFAPPLSCLLYSIFPCSWVWQGLLSQPLDWGPGTGDASDLGWGPGTGDAFDLNGALRTGNRARF